MNYCQWATWLAVVLHALALQGCSIFHSPAKEALGKAANTAWKASDVRKVVDTAGMQFEELHQRELEAIARSAALRKAFELQGLVDGYNLTLEGAEAFLQERAEIKPGKFPCATVAVTKVCRFDSALMGQVIKASGSVASFEEDVARLDGIARFAGLPHGLPACSVVSGEDKAAAEKARAGVTDWVANGKLTQVVAPLGPYGEKFFSACDELVLKQAKRRKVLGESGGNDLSGQLDRVDRLKGQIAAFRAQAASKEQNLAAAETAADEEAKKVSSLKALQEKIGNLQKAAKDIITAAQLAPNNPFLAELAAKVKKDSILDFFKAVKAAEPGKAPPETSPKAAKALVLFANAVDKNKERMEVAYGYSAVAMVLEERLAEIEEQRAARQGAVLKQHLALATEMAAAMVSSLQGYSKASALLSGIADRYPGANLHAALVGKPVVAAGAANAAPMPADDRMRLWEGVGGYLYSHGEALQRTKMVQAQEIALERAERIKQSELNLAVWDASVSTSMDLLEQWSAMGLKADDFYKFAHAFFTAAIAAGVNK